MKPFTTLILTFSVALVQAQTNPATPNAGFEDWTHYSANGGYDDPNEWTCLNPYTAFLGTVTCFKDSIDVHSGKYSVQLITMPISSQTAPGTITTGTINTSNQTINGGIPYTLHPDSIIGWYEDTMVSGDNGDIEFYLFRAKNTDTIGEAFFKTPTTTVKTFTRFSLPVIYRSSDPIDTALWIITSSDNQITGHNGSQLIVDDLGLVFDSTTGINTINNPVNITVGPNPSTGFISINNNSGAKSLLFTLIDVTGRKVEEERITAGANYMQLTGISEGVYIYFLQDEQNAVIKTGKIVVQQ